MASIGLIKAFARSQHNYQVKSNLEFLKLEKQTVTELLHKNRAKKKHKMSYIKGRREKKDTHVKGSTLPQKCLAFMNWLNRGGRQKLPTRYKEKLFHPEGVQRPGQRPREVLGSPSLEVFRT